MHAVFESLILLVIASYFLVSFEFSSFKSKKKIEVWVDMTDHLFKTKQNKEVWVDMTDHSFKTNKIRRCG